jgi:peptide/nickel transport system substrate-binding protein
MARLGWLVSNRPHSAMHALAWGVTVALAFSACSTSAEPSVRTSEGSTATPSLRGPQPQRGGTLYLLRNDDLFDSLDPTLVYNGMDLAFFGATLMRSLVTYTSSPDAETADTLQPDLATDTGTPNADATQWTFTLRDGPRWQDGTPITCEDVKYGISRQFATEVLGGGPTYAMAYLDIPTEADGSSAYKGPYDGTGQGLYDRAVACAGSTITFHLNRTVTDFNYATTLGMYPVKQSADTGASYAQEGSPPPNFLSSGPYQIERYTTGAGGKMVLVRNPNWDAGSDPVRKALPDRWEVDFGLDKLVVDQRLIASSGDDAMAVMYDSLQPVDLTTVFADPQTPNPAFAGRAFSAYGPAVWYVYINTLKLPNLLQRQAIAVALDRGAVGASAGGAFLGELADGVIPRSLAGAYAPTGWSTDLFGEPVPPEGNPDLARRLIAQSGEAMPALTFDWHEGKVSPGLAENLQSSLARAGIEVTSNPIPGPDYWNVVFSDEQAHELGGGVWGADWPNASTIIPPLFTDAGGWNLSRVRDQDFVDLVQDAFGTVDPVAQTAKWQALNREAMQRAYAIPLAFILDQGLCGARVGPLYPWGPYGGSWPFGEMGVLPG